PQPALGSGDPVLVLPAAAWRYRRTPALRLDRLLPRRDLARAAAADAVPALLRHRPRLGDIARTCDRPALAAGLHPHHRAGRLMLTSLRLIPTLLALNLKARMEYRADFIINGIAQIITYSSSIVVLWLLVHRFGDLVGWSFPDLAFLF